MKDTNDFLRKIEECSSDIDEKAILVTMDVKSLYTNIPNDEGIRATRTFLSRAGKSLLIPAIVEFPWLNLTLNNFIFNFEENFIYPRIVGKACLYLRYIDDIFLIWKGTQAELESFIKEVHGTIKFDIKFSKTSVQFLDTTATITPNCSIQTSLY